MQDAAPISPAWLESRGFLEYIPGNEDLFDNFPTGYFDVEVGLYDQCFVEKKWHRQRFYIVLSPFEIGEEVAYRFQVYIQENVAMDFVAIPNGFREMTEYHFALLFEAIRREPLQIIPSSVAPS